MAQDPTRARIPVRIALLASALLASLLPLTACETPIRVSTDMDPGADFSSYQSYAWISADPLIRQVQGVTEGPPISPIDDTRIRAAVATELGAKGWKQVDDPEAADLIVSYGLGAHERTEIYETPAAGGYYGRRGYVYGGWYAGSTVRTEQVTEGTLTLEFFDRRTKQAVWVGWASKRIYGSSKQNRDQTVTTAIQKILASFPAR
jgi:hypothetical protein